jgi:xanthine/uracil permease
VFGPLPTLHRVVLVLAALGVGIGLGAWSGAMPQVPVTLESGIALGAVVGVVTAFVLLHDFHRRTPPSTDRVRRRPL